jgi:predicted RNA-binding Zn ribbon-like protein
MTGDNAGFRLVADHLALDFVNTRTTDQNGLSEALSSFASALAWFVQAGLLSTSESQAMLLDRTPAAEATLSSLRAFRAMLRGMLDEHRATGAIGRQYVDAINEQLGRCGCARTLVRKGDAYVVHVQFHFTQPSDLLMPLANAAADLITREDLTRIKRCGSDCCDMYFLDTSRNRSRTWCDMALCGNRAKAATYYRRSRELRRAL